MRSGAHPGDIDLGDGSEGQRRRLDDEIVHRHLGTRKRRGLEQARITSPVAAAALLRRRWAVWLARCAAVARALTPVAASFFRRARMSSRTMSLLMYRCGEPSLLWRRREAMIWRGEGAEIRSG